MFVAKYGMPYSVVWLSRHVVALVALPSLNLPSWIHLVQVQIDLEEQQGLPQGKGTNVLLHPRGQNYQAYFSIIILPCLPCLPFSTLLVSYKPEVVVCSHSQTRNLKCNY